jgi:hypothetical protein
MEPERVHTPSAQNALPERVSVLPYGPVVVTLPEQP